MGDPDAPEQIEGGVCATYQGLVDWAEQQYPKLSGILQNHHEDPIYTGGPTGGAISNIPAPYHQLITNFWRELIPYGQDEVDPSLVAKYWPQVYGKLPLPGYPGGIPPLPPRLQGSPGNIEYGSW